MRALAGTSTLPRGLTLEMTDPADRPPRDQSFREEALVHLPSVNRFARSLTRHEADAEDLVQETYLRAYRAWDQFQPGTSCRAWLFTICRNAYLRSRQREQRMVVVDDVELEALSMEGPSAPASPVGDAELFSQRDLGPVIEGALDALPEHFCSAVVLVDIEDQSYQAAAEVLKVPVGTLRSRLFRARRLLRDALRDYAREEGIVVEPAAARENPR
jgi:RNA polymerase sigma-70 factor, ECF subfamily